MIRRLSAYLELKRAERVLKTTQSPYAMALAMGVPEDALAIDLEDILAVRLSDLHAIARGQK